MSFEAPKINSSEKEQRFTIGQRSTLMNLSNIIDRAGLRIFSIYKKYGLDKAESEKSVSLESKIEAGKEVAAELENFKREFTEERNRSFQEKKLKDLSEYLYVAEEIQKTYKASKEKEIEEMLSRSDKNNPMIRVDKARISAMEFLEEKGRTEGLFSLIPKESEKKR